MKTRYITRKNNRLSALLTILALTVAMAAPTIAQTVTDRCNSCPCGNSVTYEPRAYGNNPSPCGNNCGGYNQNKA